MALIIKAEIPAGPSIEDAIMDCVIFSQKTGVMVKTEINDIPMLISYGKLFGASNGDLSQDIRNCTDFFVKTYHTLNEDRLKKEVL